MKYLTADQVVRLHHWALAEHGGLDGVRSSQGLQSAVAAPQHSAFGEDAYPTLAAKAAALGYFLALNHPFNDGNKRTALAALDTFLTVNGHELGGTDDEVADVFERIAAGTMGKDEFFTWIAEHVGRLSQTEP